MSDALVAPGDTLIIDPSGGTNDHLWFVLAVYVSDLVYEPHALIANATTITRFADRTCILTPRDADAHPFIKHESYIFYAEAREIEVSALQQHASNRCTPASPQLLERIKAGLHRSPHTRRGLKTLVSIAGSAQPALGEPGAERRVTAPQTDASSMPPGVKTPPKTLSSRT